MFLTIFIFPKRAWWWDSLALFANYFWFITSLPPLYRGMMGLHCWTPSGWGETTNPSLPRSREHFIPEGRPSEHSLFHSGPGRDCWDSSDSRGNLVTGEDPHPCHEPVEQMRVHPQLFWGPKILVLFVTHVPQLIPSNKDCGVSSLLFKKSSGLHHLFDRNLLC